MAKLEEAERDYHRTNFDPTRYMKGSEGQLQTTILHVLLSIDERLAETNDFYLQNQEERNRPNG